MAESWALFVDNLGSQPEKIKCISSNVIINYVANECMQYNTNIKFRP